MTTAERLKALYIECFPEDSYKVVDILFDGYLGEKNSFFSEDGKGNIICALYIIEKTLFFKGNFIKLPYITALGTKKEHRYQKLAENLIKKALQKLYSEGFPFVALYPFSHGFYEKYGFFTPSYNINLEGTEVPCSYMQAKAVYDKFCEDLDYYILRDEKDFLFSQNIMSADNDSYRLIKADGNIIGYKNNEEIIPLTYRESDEKGTMLRIVNANIAMQYSDECLFEKNFTVADTLINENNFSLNKISNENNIITISELGESIFGLKNNKSHALKGFLADKY